jgi:hypothetical protein
VQPPANADGRGNDRHQAERVATDRGREQRRSETGPGNQPQGQSDEGRRKRPNQARYVGWGDGQNREYCDRMSHVLPRTFPVASHTGAATIRATVVARRSDSYLMCTYDHCGPHVWPDGDVVSGDEATESSGIVAQR